MEICNFNAGLESSFFLIAGPCVIESRELTIEIAGILKEITTKLNIQLIYKSSFDKANRSSDDSFRGLGIDHGLSILSDIRDQLNIPVLTDVHEVAQVELVASVVDVIQVPAFLCRQTDLIHACATTLKPINIKKGQFLAPSEMIHVVKKARKSAIQAGGDGKNILVCERGTSFGYNDLISDMRSLVILRETNCPVVFDATHSVQRPGLVSGISGGDSCFVSVLARAAIAVGVSGLFIETHPNPANAKSDSKSTISLSIVENLLISLIEIEQARKRTESLFLL